MIKSYNKPFVVWACLCAFYCFQYILRLLPNVILPSIAPKFNISSIDFGHYAGIYYVGYILFHIPIGIMMVKFSGRLILSICILIATIGILPLVYNNWNLVVVGRFMTGVGSSAAIIGAFHFLRIISPKTFTKNLGITVCIGLITAIYLIQPISTFVNGTDFNNTILVIVAIGLCLSALSYYVIPHTQGENCSTISLLDIKAVLLNSKLIAVAVLAGMMVGALEGFADAWGSSFISRVYSCDMETSNSIVSTILLGMCIGSFILPIIANKIQSFYSITLLSGITMCIGFLYLIAGIASIKGLYTTCLIIGISSAYQPVILAKISTLVQDSLSGVAVALGNMIIMFFGFFFHNAIGYLMNYFWDGAFKNGEKFYSAAAYIKGISIIPSMLCISSIGFLVLILIEYVKRQDPNIDISLPYVVNNGKS